MLTQSDVCSVTLKANVQEGQYEFPYHFIPHFVSGAPRLERSLDWGLQYLAYIGEVKRRVLSLNPTSVLDVGCGDGKLLSELGAISHRVGIDTSHRAIQAAKLFAPNVDFRCGSVADIDEAFDVITCIHTLEHIPPPDCRAFVTALAKRLRPGGTLIVVVPSVNRVVNPKHFQHFTQGTLTNLLAPQFRLTRADYLIRTTFITRTLRRIAVNRYFVTRSDFVMRFIWRMFTACGIAASEHDGEHIIAHFSPA